MIRPSPARIAAAAAFFAFSLGAYAQGFSSVSGAPTQEAVVPPADATGVASPTASAQANAAPPAFSSSSVPPAPPVQEPTPAQQTTPVQETAPAPSSPVATETSTTMPFGTAPPPPAPAVADAPAAPTITVPFGSVSSATVAAAPPPRTKFESADRVLVKKSERRLYLMRANQIVAEYPIRLGLNPKGPKEREGDFRTPEGTYQLVRRNPQSSFFLSLEVSYPNDADRARAKKAGVRPGGLIMIHGQPNVPRKSPEYYQNFDWTDGCIAVSNPDMVDIWLRTGLGTTIEIVP